MKVDDENRAYSTRERDEKYIQNSGRQPEGKNYL